MSLTPLRKTTGDKPHTDLQTAVEVCLRELQASPLAQAKLVTITLPSQNSVNQDVTLTHNFGRPMIGYFIVRTSWAVKNAVGVPPVIYDSPNTPAQPNIFGLVRFTGIVPQLGGPFTLTLMVF